MNRDVRLKISNEALADLGLAGFLLSRLVGILLLLGLLDDLVLPFCVQDVLRHVPMTGNSLHLEWKIK